MGGKVDGWMNGCRPPSIHGLVFQRLVLDPIVVVFFAPVGKHISMKNKVWGWSQKLGPLYEPNSGLTSALANGCANADMKPELGI